MKFSWKTFWISYFGLVGVVAFSLWLIVTMGYRVITTPSMPMGIWKLTPLKGPVERGQVVWLCPPDNPYFWMLKERFRYPGGDCPGNFCHMMKPVAAVAGDTVILDEHGVSVNGRLLKNSRILIHDRKGRSFDGIPMGEYKVQPGAVWLVSSYNPESIDSRYFGPVSVKLIEGTTQPVWIH